MLLVSYITYSFGFLAISLRSCTPEVNVDLIPILPTQGYRLLYSYSKLCMSLVFSSRTFLLIFLREERRKFITAKYADKQFSLSSDEVDLGDGLSLQSDSSSSDENDRNILSEVKQLFFY